MVRFTLSLLGSAFALCIGAYYLGKKGHITVPSYYLETTVLFTISAWVTFKKLARIDSPSTFVQAYLGSIVIQLLIWIGYLGFVMYFDRIGAKANAIYFLLNCLIFIALEVSFLFFRKLS